MCRHGRNCGGNWNPETARAKYKMKPDKESPLWDPTSLIIYRWTSTEIDGNTVYSIVYNGSVWKIDKEWGIGSRGFSAVGLFGTEGIGRIGRGCFNSVKTDRNQGNEQCSRSAYNKRQRSQFYFVREIFQPHMGQIVSYWPGDYV